MTATPSLKCPTHQLTARYRPTSEHVHQGRDYGPIWECPRPDCDARVGCHPDGSPKGSLAGKQLRNKRMAAHAVFDPLWTDWKLAYPNAKSDSGKIRRIMRARAYAWLAFHMEQPFEETHIAHFDEAQCQRVVDLVRLHRPTAASVREWAKAKAPHGLSAKTRGPSTESAIN